MWSRCMHVGQETVCGMGWQVWWAGEGEGMGSRHEKAGSEEKKAQEPCHEGKVAWTARLHAVSTQCLMNNWTAENLRETKRTFRWKVRHTV